MSLSAAVGARVARQRSESLRPVLRYDPVLLGAVLLLLTAGVVMVYSASAVYAGARLGDGLWFFKRQALGAGIGLLALLAVINAIGGAVLCRDHWGCSGVDLSQAWGVIGDGQRC